MIKTIFLLFIFLIPMSALTEEMPDSEISVTTPSNQPIEKSEETFPKLIPSTTETEINEQLPSIWQKTYPRLEKLITLQDQHEQLPQSAWFSTDKASNQEKINELIEESLNILGISSAQEYTKTIRQLEDRMIKARQTISEYREQQRSAPKESYLKTTIKQYDDKIKQLEQEIAVDTQKIAQKKQDIVEQLNKMGINISREHVETLLASIIGDKTIEMSVIFSHVKAINDELSKLMIANKEDTQAARRYYGMYTILLKMLITMQQEFIRTIEQQYLPQIQHKIKENQKLMADTQQLLNETFEDHRRIIYEKNLESQKLIAQTADLYQIHLTHQVEKVRQIMANLGKDWALAMNTYQTVKISGELVEMIRFSNQQFNTLANLQIPPLMPFENLQMKLEYEKLTTELRRSEQLK